MTEQKRCVKCDRKLYYRRLDRELCIRCDPHAYELFRKPVRR